MKLSFFLTLITCLQVSATAYSQRSRITVNVSEVKLMKFLKLVEKKSNCRFVYNDNAIAPDLTVSLQVNDAAVEDVLTTALANTGLHFTLLKNDLIVIAPEHMVIQDVIIQGKVTDKNGTPLPGVSIKVDKTGKGTITNERGEFKLEAPGAANLIFTYIGYQQLTMPVNNRTVIEAVLADDTKGLSEVIVVGYGVQKKASLTGSVATVSGKDVRAMPVANLSNSLIGRAPGLIARQNSGEPGNDGASLSIRGKSTFGYSGMLVIVDGIQRSFAELNPADIETISILKDASSAAIYGSRAANGVMLITTKRGSTGIPTISYNGYVGFQQPTRIPKQLNSLQYMQMYNDGLKSNGQAPRYSEDDINTVRNNPDPLRGLANTDWWKSTMNNTAMQTQHDLSVRGGSDKARYYVSIGYLDQNSLYKSTNYKRYNIRSNVDANIGKHLVASVDLAARLERRTGPGVNATTIFNSIIRAVPLDADYYPNGLPAGTTGGRSPLLDATESGNRKQDWNTFQSNFSLKYDVPGVKGLSLKGVAAYDKRMQYEKQFAIPYSYYSYNASSKTYDKITRAGSINLTQNSEQQAGITTQAIVNYIRSFGKHDVDGTLLYETYNYRMDKMNAYREQFDSPLIPELFAGSGNGLKNDGTADIYTRAGVAGRFNYAYSHKYLLTATFRYDGSLSFASDKRWGFFPGVSAGWVISEENFFKDNVRAVNYLKFKASYGQLGNDSVRAFQYLPTYYAGTGNGTTSVYIIDGKPYNGIFSSGYPNSDIGWEVATTTDFGFEASLWNRMLTIDAGYFYKRTSKILRPRTASVPGTFGETLPYQNVGIVDNQGFELELGHENRFGQVDFNAKGTFTYARNKVIYMDEPANVQASLRQTGRPFDQYSGLVAIGIFQDEEEIKNAPKQYNFNPKPGDIRYADINGDGVINDDDRTIIGRSKVPEIVYGLNLGASWKNFDISMLWQGAANFNTYLANELAYPFFNVSNPMTYMMDYWTPENRDAAFPRPVAGGNANNLKQSSFWLRDASYIKLRSLNIGYSLPASMLKKYKVQQLRLYVAAANLLTISKLKGLDPEVPSETRGYYPQQRSVNFGVNLTL
ncbi:TonB-dependent receptor [Chitinophaga sp. Mgbs1]|uniref:TonB-dependent receptor n=1 Tax=Chitinophaga solisilvae TaxID=1233460 RepID=A0A9Q5GTJ4_9BACT|nr:TonB-dependent receptor [Chitinophaga solisilvae]